MIKIKKEGFPTVKINKIGSRDCRCLRTLLEESPIPFNSYDEEVIIYNTEGNCVYRAWDYNTVIDGDTVVISKKGVK